MRLILITLVLLNTLNLTAQTKDEIITDLEKVFNEHSIMKSSEKNAEIYYNIEEKILDINGFGTIDLIKNKIIYAMNGESHSLRIIRQDNFTQANIYFENKKSIYEVIDLIHLLKKIE